MKNKVLYEFDRFCLDPQEKFVKRDGNQVKLTQKEFNTLLVLVEARGRLITKRELLEKVWPGINTTEHNLNVTISRVREALGQGQNGNPYILTVPREGYRFLASVNVKDQELPFTKPPRLPGSSEEMGADSIDQGTVSASTESEWIREHQENLAPSQLTAMMPEVQPQDEATSGKRYTKWLWLGIGTGLAAVLLFFLTQRSAIHLLRFDQLTDNGRDKGGLQTDGSILYFIEKEVNRQILVTSPVNGNPIRQINTVFSNVDLQDISNDGQHLLLTSFEGMEWERPLWIMPAHGGTPKRVGDALCHFARWSPDNHKIGCVAGATIMVLDSNGSSLGTIGPFSSPPYGLVWAPDSNRLRFVLEGNAQGTKSWEISLDENGTPGPARPLSFPSGRVDCVNWAWTKNDRYFVCTKRQADEKLAVFVTPKNAWLPGWGHEFELPVKVGNIAGITPSNKGDAVYLLVGDSNRGELWKSDPNGKSFHIFLNGLSAEFLAFSRDGQWITFESTLDRSLWRSKVDGTEALQLVRPPMAVEFSAWSPDGSQIAFMGQQPGKPWRIYLISKDGGVPEEAAVGTDKQGAPTWSKDGKKLVYGNVECEHTQMCSIQILDLVTKRTTKIQGSQGFRTARWSPDGKYIAALQNQVHELMLFDVKNQHWELLADSVTGDNINWSSDSQAIYADSPQGEKPVIERLQISDKTRTTVVDLAPLRNLSGGVHFWFGLAPDNSTIVVHGLAAPEIYVLEWTDR